MTGSVLLDTSILIRYLNQNAEITERVEATDQLYIPSPALGELYHGSGKSGNPERNRANIETLLLHMNVLSVDAATASYYGEIKPSLSKKGRPIPENDIWIAAFSVQHQIPLAYRDEHFDQVEGLDRLQW